MPARQQDEDKDVEVRCSARVSAGRTPGERSLHSCTLHTVDGRRIVYLYGGRSKSGGTLDDLHVLDLDANVWSSPKIKGNKPAGRYGHSAVVHGESLFVFGGQSKVRASSDGSPPNPSLFVGDRMRADAETEVCAELHAYHASTMEWKELNGEYKEFDSPSPRCKAASCLIPERHGQAKMLIFGGCNGAEVALNDLYTLDLASSTWSTPTASGTVPSARYGHSATLLPAVRKVIVLGGTCGLSREGATDPEFPPHRTTAYLCPMTVHVLDIDAMAWSTAMCNNAGTGAEPPPRAYHSTALLGKNLFVTGGQVQHGHLAQSHYIHGAYILEVVKNQWEHNTIKGDSFIPYPGCALLAHSACAIDSSGLIIFGGALEMASGFDCVNTFWDVATDAKQKLNPSELPMPVGTGGLYNTMFKLLVVGDAGVGKTCLIHRFVDDVFSSTGKSTVGVDFKATTIEMDGKQVQLQVRSN